MITASMSKSKKLSVQSNGDIHHFTLHTSDSKLLWEPCCGFVVHLSRSCCQHMVPDPHSPFPTQGQQGKPKKF